jgi:hypothetical protein
MKIYRILAEDSVDFVKLLYLRRCKPSLSVSYKVYELDFSDARQAQTEL